MYASGRSISWFNQANFVQYFREYKFIMNAFQSGVENKKKLHFLFHSHPVTNEKCENKMQIKTKKKSSEKCR